MSQRFPFITVIILLNFLLVFPTAAPLSANPLIQSETPNPIETEPPSWTLTGESSDSAGEIMSNIGDINGDGFDDVAFLLFEGFSVYLGTADGLASTPDFTGEEVAPDDYFFVQSLAAAGDVNGDGYADMIMGDPYWDVDEVENVGSARLFYGSADGFDAGSYWEVVGDQAEAQFGQSIAALGDVNGDGYDDVVIAAPGEYADESSGTVYAYYGSETGLSESPDFVVGDETSYRRFGESVSGAGDINGDGYGDMLVAGGDADTIFLYSGSSEGLLARPVAELFPEAYDYIFGESVTGLGDVNGDGFDDVAVDAEDIDDLIKAYIYYGSADGFATEPDLRIALENPNFVASKIAGVGDINGDGFDDFAFALAIPSYEEDGSGTVYLYYGSEDGLPEEPSSAISGSENGDEFGSVLVSGDINGDGLGDLIVGAPYSTEGGDYAGKVYLFNGTTEGISFAMPPSEPVADESESTTRVLAELAAPEPGSLFGYQAEGAGDVNGDGYVDLLVTAPQAEAFHGAAYLYLGGPVGFAAEPDWQAVGEGADEDFGFMAGQAGDLNGDGYSDIFVTAPYHDGDKGKVYVYHGSEDGLADEPQWWFTGGEAAYAGFIGAAVGDINGDGFDDFAISVEIPMEDEEVVYQMGLFYGSETGLAEEVGFVTDEEKDLGALFGTTGDVNGDGYDDLFVAPSISDEVPGTVNVLHGGEDGLDGTIQFAGEGINAGDYYGWEATRAGDVNGDGFDDFLVAAPAMNDTIGTVYLHYGSEDGLEVSPGWEVEGFEEETWFGISMAALGDINGDSFDDFALGEDENSDGPTYIHIHLGGPEGPGYIAAEMHEVELLEFYDWGTRVNPVGDVDQDGLDDYLIAEPGYPDGAEDGRVIIYGVSAVEAEEASDSGILPALDWAPSREQALESGEPGEAFGWQTVIIADVNGDGYDELAIASYGNPTLDLSGRLLVHYGSADGVSDSPDWTVGPAEWPALEDEDGAPIEDLATFMVSSVGDVNGDGYGDLAATINSASTDASRLLVYHGGEEGLALEPNWIGAPDEPFAEIIGMRIAALGDVNGDGYDDVAIVTVQISDSESANISIYHGSEDGLEIESALSRTVAIGSDFFMDVAGAGDLNDDGYNELLIGFPHAVDEDASQLMVLLGSEDGIDIEPVWEADSMQDESSLGMRVAGIGDVNGDRLPDFATTEVFDESAMVRVYLNDDDLTEQTLGGDADLLMGMVINGVGDINGDGYDDLFTGSGNTIDGHYIWQIFPGGRDGIGQAPLYENIVDGNDPFFMFFQQYGSGDLNGDGYADFVLADFDFEAIQDGDDAVATVTVYYGGESAVDDISNDTSEETSEEAAEADSAQSSGTSAKPNAASRTSAADEEIDDTADGDSSDARTLSESFWETGTDLLLDGEYDDALTQFDLAVDADPTFALAHNGRGRVFLAQEMYADAIENFDRSIDADAEFWQAYFNRATAYYRLDGFEETVEDMNVVVELIPDYADTYYWRGFAYLGLDDIENAIVDFELLLELEPEHVQKDEVESVLAELELVD